MFNLLAFNGGLIQYITIPPLPGKAGFRVGDFCVRAVDTVARGSRFQSWRLLRARCRHRR